MRGIVLLLAAGEGTRLGTGPKGFVELGGVPLLRHAAERALAASRVDGLVAAVPAGAEGRATAALDGLDGVVGIVAGGATRQRSARAALDAAPDTDAVVVHDAARALCPSEVFDRCLDALDHHEAACAVLPVTDTVKEAEGDVLVRTLDRTRLVAAQTPQAVRSALYRRAHAAADADGIEATDDCGLVERLGVEVRAVPGDPQAVKITTHHDLLVAAAILEPVRP